MKVVDCCNGEIMLDVQEIYIRASRGIKSDSSLGRRYNKSSNVLKNAITYGKRTRRMSRQILLRVVHNYRRGEIKGPGYRNKSVVSVTFTLPYFITRKVLPLFTVPCFLSYSPLQRNNGGIKNEGRFRFKKEFAH